MAGKEKRRATTTITNQERLELIAELLLEYELKRIKQMERPGND